MNESKKYSILVNSTDSYADCWEPFFKLLSVYWPNCKQNIILNTETKEFSYPGLNILSASVLKRALKKKISWSENLLMCLDKIETDIILYLQEDYFLCGKVNEKMIKKIVDVMQKNDYACVRLHGGKDSAPCYKTKYPFLWEVNKNSKDRICLQAALWNKKYLIKYLKINEDPWDFEFFGSRRVRKYSDKILCVNRDMYHAGEDSLIFPYMLTGLIGGKWYKPVVEKLFAKHNIYVDYSKRGFYNQLDHIKSRKMSLGRRIYRKIKYYLFP